MSEQLDPVQMALAVRQGRLRLRDLPAAIQPTIRAVANSLTDAQASTILTSRERQARPHGRTGSKPWRAGS